MVREIITINVGQAGIQLSESIWRQYCSEHEIDCRGYLVNNNDEKENKENKENSNNNNNKCSNAYINCFFDESESGAYVPRNLCIDLESNVIDDLKESNIGSLFFNEYLIHGNEDAANNYARGRFTVGKEIINKVNNAITKLYEKCDKLQAFIINHSVGGGTGSGLGANILERLTANYRKISRIGFEIYPSQRISTCVVEPYNALLSTSSLIDFTDISFMLDNEALYDICKHKLDILHPSYININNLISKSVSSLTSSLRFEGELNLDIDDLRTNLVPFPKLHFMMSSLSPILTKHKMETFKCDVRTITDLCFDENSFFVKIPEFECDNDKYMAVLLMYRGNVVSKEANEATQWIKNNKKCSFVEWSPCGVKISLNEKALSSIYNNNNNNGIIMNDNINDIGWCKQNAIMIGNNTGISKVFSNIICKKFDLMYSQRAFVHWYVGEGMEEGEFDEARENLGYLEKDYLDIINDDDDDDNDDDDDDDNSNDDGTGAVTTEDEL